MDDATLKSLIALEVTVRGGPEDKEDIKRAKQAQEKQPGTIRRGKAEMTTKKAMTLDELKMELREDVDDALEKNFETFIGKFELQVSMLQIALERYIRTENDRVIGVVKDVMTQGPHMKIKDPVRLSAIRPSMPLTSLPGAAQNMAGHGLCVLSRRTRATPTHCYVI